MKYIWFWIGLIVGAFFIYSGTEIFPTDSNSRFAVWFGAGILSLSWFAMGHTKGKEEEKEYQGKIKELGK